VTDEWSFIDFYINTNGRLGHGDGRRLHKKKPKEGAKIASVSSGSFFQIASWMGRRLCCFFFLFFIALFLPALLFDGVWLTELL
jgi:hypothetical protein